MSPSERIVTWEELSERKGSDDLWVAIDGVAYDVTEFSKKHPGGPVVLERCSGQDASEPFHAYHPDRVNKLLSKFRIGRMETETREPRPAGTVAYHKLFEQFKKEGLFDTNYSFYYRLLAFLVALYCLSWYLMVQGHWLLGAFSVAFFWQQVAFVGHDSGHNGITHNRLKDSRICLASTAFVGIGLSYWKASHNVHHTVVNSVDCDPDIQHLPLLAVSPEYFGSLYSQYSYHTMSYDAIAEFFIPYQHWTFFPILGIAKWGLYIKSLDQLINGRAFYDKWMEVVAGIVFTGWYAGMVLLVPGWWQKAAFVILSHAAFMILHLQICLSHFSRHTFEGEAKEGDWMQVQLNGTMNWRCPAWLDWFHGGLQFQIEHHLFPRMPRHNLRKVSEKVESTCKELGIEYVSPGFWGATWQTVQGLRDTALEAKKLRDAQVKLK